MAKNIIVQQIFELSQNEGLNDSEIGTRIGYARGSVQRIRMENNIPKANREMRKDKECTCVKCTKEFFIRRNDPDNKMYLCPECEKEDGAAYNRLINDKIANQ
jgi:hypothetical protein